MDLIRVGKGSKHHYINTRYIEEIVLHNEDGCGVIEVKVHDGYTYLIYQGSGLYRDALEKLQLERP